MPETTENGRDAALMLAAHKAVRKALDRGDLKSASCEVCGHWRTVAHHDDYTQPLQVRWLCYVHHADAHGWTRPPRRQIGFEVPLDIYAWIRSEADNKGLSMSAYMRNTFIRMRDAAAQREVGK